MRDRQIIKIFPGEINGLVNAPASKSMMIRAIAIAHLAESPITIQHPSYCDDALAALQATKDLGSQFEEYEEQVVFEGSEKVKFAELNCGESGLSIRMFPPLAAVNGGHFIFDAEGSLRNRPLEMMLKPLRALGLQVNSRNGFAPLEIKGQLKGGTIEVNGSMSSQFLSGLLMSLPLITKSSVIKVFQLKSIPYIDMTLQVMAHHGVQVQHQGYKKFVIQGDQHYLGLDETVEGDWSGAAFLLVAGAIGGSIRVTGMDIHSKQADRQILNALELAGAKVTIEEQMIRVERNNLDPFNLDITHCPDLAPPLVVLAAYCNGITRLKGAGRLSVKESDRAKVLQSEFSNLGVDIRLEGDEILIKGGKIGGGLFDSNGDHRMAMAAAIAGIGAESPVELSNPGCVSKSYPGFFKDFINIGGKYE